MKRMLMLCALSVVLMSGNTVSAAQIGQKTALSQFSPGSFHCERARELAAQKEAEAKADASYDQPVKGKAVSSKSLSGSNESSS